MVIYLCFIFVRKTNTVEELTVTVEFVYLCLTGSDSILITKCSIYLMMGHIEVAQLRHKMPIVNDRERSFHGMASLSVILSLVQ